jgi:hypothetical protein
MFFLLRRKAIPYAHFAVVLSLNGLDHGEVKQQTNNYADQNVHLSSSFGGSGFRTPAITITSSQVY